MEIDWQKLFLSPEGRVRRQTFWIGVLILFAANFILAFVPFIGQLFHLFSIYVTVCLYSKRLHDMGRTAWLMVAPFVISFGLLMAGGFLFGWAIVSGAMMGFNPAAGFTALTLGGLGGLLMLCSLAGLVYLAFLLWIGLAPGQVGGNSYGPDPKAEHAVDVF